MQVLLAHVGSTVSFRNPKVMQSTHSDNQAYISPLKAIPSFSSDSADNSSSFGGKISLKMNTRIEICRRWIDQWIGKYIPISRDLRAWDRAGFFSLPRVPFPVLLSPSFNLT